MWQAAESTGYPFGTHVQLMLLTGCRCDEWASARVSWIDTDRALMVIPAGEYKSDHVHVVPLVSQAMEILKRIPKPKNGEYLLPSTDGRAPIQGVPKYFQARLLDAILAITGEKSSKKFTSHDLRRPVATRLAESLGDAGDKLAKRVLGHSDGSVTAIYNRYAYVKEMRRALEQWANDLACTQDPSGCTLTPRRLGVKLSVIMEQPVRWTVRVSKETDVSVRTFLAQRGMKKGDLAKFIEEAVRWRVLDQTVAETKARNANVPPAEIEAAIDEALRFVRAERFATARR